MEKKIILIMVGLPARGKSYTSNNLQRYLSWSGLKCRVFNSGNLRRERYPDKTEHNFFDPNNQYNYKIREKISIDCFNELLDWLIKDGHIAIFDATNSTIDRRNKLIQIIKQRKLNYKPMFIEILSNDVKIINNNIKLKSLSPDYIEKGVDFAIKDFNSRLKFYQSKYQTINDDEELNYIKVLKESNSMITKNVVGSIETLITSFLQNLQINKNPIYISRHGQSIYNTLGKLGGDSGLTKDGLKYSEKLYNYISEEINKNFDNFHVFTSCLKRTIMTGQYFTKNNSQCNLLNEINAGICEHLTYSQVKEQYPELYQNRNSNKLEFRYPEGESYLDLVEKLKLFILNIECIKNPYLIISHRAVIRVLLSYFMNYNLIHAPFIDVKLNQVIKLIPSSNKYTIEYINL